MRTVLNSKTTDRLGRYYTESAISKLLVDILPRPSMLLDLGAGEGSLSLEASSKWDGLNLVTVDVDQKASNVLARRLKKGNFVGQHWHYHHDALEVSLREHLIKDLHIRPSVALCNPPFLVPKWRKGFSEIVEDAGFSGSIPAINSTDAALLFLSQNLRVLEDGGTLGIFVPDSLVSATKYRRFRTTLLEKYDVVRAIRLPRDSFIGTDALAHILVIAKRNSTSDKVLLSGLASRHGSLRSIEVHRDLAALRLDYQYHVTENRGNVSQLTLGDVAVDLRRGSFNSAEVRGNSAYILHTTDITAQMRGVWFDFSRSSGLKALPPKGCTIAEHGDILVARVGRNAFEKVIGVSHGSVPISDCIFRVRVRPEHRLAAMHNLTSTYGTQWLESRACGVAARHLIKADLLALPLLPE